MRFRTIQIIDPCITELESLYARHLKQSQLIYADDQFRFGPLLLDKAQKINDKLTQAQGVTKDSWDEITELLKHINNLFRNLRASHLAKLFFDSPYNSLFEFSEIQRHFQDVLLILKLRCGLRIFYSQSVDINIEKIKDYFALYKQTPAAIKTNAVIYVVENRRAASSFDNENIMQYSYCYLDYLQLAEISVDVICKTFPMIFSKLTNVLGSYDFLHPSQPILPSVFRNDLIVSTVTYLITQWHTLLFWYGRQANFFLEHGNFAKLKQCLQSISRYTFAKKDKENLECILSLLDFLTEINSKKLNERAYFTQYHREIQSICSEFEAERKSIATPQKIRYTISEDEAKKIILKFIRNYRIKQINQIDAYHLYSSMTSASESTCALSLLMFGMRVAIFDEKQIANPYRKIYGGYYRMSNKPETCEIFRRYCKTITGEEPTSDPAGIKSLHPIAVLHQSPLALDPYVRVARHEQMVSQQDINTQGVILRLTQSNTNSTAEEKIY